MIEGKNGRFDKQVKELADLNKVALVYSLACGHEAKDLTARYQLMMDTLAEISTLFNSNGIKYSIFKTIKPFPTTPSDIDVLLSQEVFGKAQSLLLSSGYRKTANDAYSSTLEKEMIIDLQQQPSVSNIPYLPKNLLIENTSVRKINGADVCTLNPEAELLVIASHSLYKEQLFTLNDYYSITLLAEQIDFSKLVNLAKIANVFEALQIVVGLCLQITESVFGNGLRICELARLIQAQKGGRVYTMPVKFPFSLVIRALINRASKDKEMRQKMLPAILRIAKPGQLFKLLSHLTRRTY
jgi:hypothetical protein